MTKKPSAPARATKRGSTHKQNVPPLQWWRWDDNASYDTVTLRKALRQIWVLAYPDAPAAIAGDEAVAIRIGLHVYAKADAPAWLLDWTGSLLLLATLDGSLTAATVLIHLRRRVRASKATAKLRRAS
ncbi:MAG: hypothetical protein JSR72_14360 [Proteobacteria bacterium]|nr:hypothetical protein [Pseudomonadota bacterium]